MTIPTKTYKVKIQTLEKMLGTAPLSKSIYEAYVATKRLKMDKKYDQLTEEQLKEAELDSVADLDEKGLTGFRCDEKGFFLPSYNIKGMLKSAASVLNGQTGFPKNFRNKVVKLVFVDPDKVYLPFKKSEIENGRPVYVEERPLRAETPQGPRTAIARSEFLPSMREFSFKIKMIQLDGTKGITESHLRDLLEYGNFEGLGQWRGAGMGRYKVVDFK